MNYSWFPFTWNNERFQSSSILTKVCSHSLGPKDECGVELIIVHHYACWLGRYGCFTHVKSWNQRRGLDYEEKRFSLPDVKWKKKAWADVVVCRTCMLEILGTTEVSFSKKKQKQNNRSQSFMPETFNHETKDLSVNSLLLPVIWLAVLKFSDTDNFLLFGLLCHCFVTGGNWFFL